MIVKSSRTFRFKLWCLALLTIGMYSAQWAADNTNVGVRREPVQDVVGLPSELQKIIYYVLSWFGHTSEG